MTKKVPIRTCIGCRERKSQEELIRFGRGRGAYLCPKMECFEKAVKKSAFARAWRCEVSKEEINGFKKEFAEKIKEFTSETAGGGGSGPR